MRRVNPPARGRLLMIIPTRGRPEAAIEAARSALENRGRTDTEILLVVDGDSQKYAHAYLDNEWSETWAVRNVGLRFQEEHLGMVATLNREAVASTRTNGYTHVGFMGDDHRVRTPGWDTELMKSAGPVGVAYADDLNMGAKLPTSVVMSAPIVRTLGFMAPPTLGHLYVDDFWRELGARLGRIEYRDDIVIEHMHPTIGKSEWDDQYRRVNSDAQFEQDERAWRAYRDGWALSIAVHRIKRAHPEEFTGNAARRPSPRPRRDAK
jgi:hypothetical protein